MKVCVLTWAIALVLDLCTKALSQAFLKERLVKIGNFLWLRLVNNSGMAFSLFSGSLWPVLLPPVVIVILGIFVHRLHLKCLGSAAAGLILGGFLGNWLERLLFGSVTDMLYFPWLPFFVCNIADIAICCGAVLLAVVLLKQNTTDKQPPGTPNQEENGNCM